MVSKLKTRILPIQHPKYENSIGISQTEMVKQIGKQNQAIFKFRIYLKASHSFCIGTKYFVCNGFDVKTQLIQILNLKLNNELKITL